MKNKKLIILVLIALIVVLVIAALKVNQNKISESNVASNNEIINEIQSINEIQNVAENTLDTINHEQENIVLESKKEDIHEVEKIIQNTPLEKETTSVAKNENQKKEVQKTQVKQENVSKGKTQDKKATTNIESSKEQTKSISQNSNNYTEKEVKVAPKTECIGNNHKMSTGNTGKWFETKAQADSYYNTEIDKWGKKWESGEIKKPEYLEKCPLGYEIWSCPQCGKWTINFYYR